MKRLLLAAALLLATAPAWAATYWVSPTGTAGKSGADSTTNATTLAWVNTNATSGDVIRFKSGTYSDPIYPRHTSNTTARIRFYGFPQDPSAVSVAYIAFGTINNGSGQDGDYCTARWVTSRLGCEVSGSNSPVRAVHGDSLVKCYLSGGIHLTWGYALLVDSCTATFSSSTGSPAIEFSGLGAGIVNGQPGTWSIGAVNDTVKHSTFTCTYTGSGNLWCVIAHGGAAYNVISDNTFNVTMARNGGFWFFSEQYESYYLSILRNTIHWTNTVVNPGNHGLFTERDSSSYGHFGYNTVVIDGVGTGDGLVSNSGSWPGTTGHNRIDGNLITTSLSKSAGYAGVFSYQNGMRSDTLEFNTIAAFGTDLPCLGVQDFSSSDNTIDGAVVRHNTFISGSPKVVDFGGSNPIANSPRFVGNIYYSTTANTSSNELLRVGSGVKLDSAGTFFARGGDATKGISYNGSSGTPGSGGNYGASGKANWGTPLFTDSSAATLNTTLRSGSYAVNASLSDGYSGATGTSIAPTLAPDLRIDLRHTVDGGVSTANTLRLVISNVGTALSYGFSGTMTLGTGLTFGAFVNDNQNGNFGITSTTFDGTSLGGLGAGDSAWVEFTVTPGAGAVPTTSTTVTLDASSNGYNGSFTSDTDVLPVVTPTAPNLRVDLRHVADGVVGIPDTLMLMVRNIGSATAAFLSSGGAHPLTITVAGSGYSNTFMTRNTDGIPDVRHSDGIQCTFNSFGFYDDLAAGDSCWIKWTVTPKAAGIGSKTITALIDSVSGAASCGGDGLSTTSYGRGTAANSYDADVLPITGPSANNAVTAVGVLKEANLYSIGIRAYLAGDADSNAVCRLFYRQYNVGAQYDSGMVMVRRTGATVHVGRLLWLSPGVTYQFYVEVTDTDGGSTSTTADTVTTRTVPTFAVTNTGGAIYVSKSGNDNNFGNSPANAVKTLTAARDRLRALPNEGVGSGIYLVGPGEWHERIDFNYGNPTPGNGYFLTGYGLADSIIIDGSYEPAAVNGYVDASHQISWSSTGVDSIYKTYYPHGDSCATVTLGFGETLHKKASMTELIQDTGAGVSGNTVGERSGWFWQNDTLYVQRATGGSPTGLALHAGYIDKLINIQVNRVRISNLTLRYAGGVQGNGTGIILGSGVAGHGDNCVFDSLKCYGLSDAGILCSGGAKSPDSCVVKNCTFSGLSVGSFAYEMTKNRNEENVTSMVILGKSWSITSNNILQMANGMTLGGLGRTDSTSGSDCEVIGNTILNTSDDPIECDLSHHINTLVAFNVMKRTVSSQFSANSGISYTPIWTGPGWCLYNLMADYKLGGFKIGGVASNGGNGTGYVLFAHNTVTTAGINAWAVLSRGHFENMHWVNNLMVSSGTGAGTYLVQHNNNNATDNDTTGEYRNDFNYNLEDTVSTNARMFNWHDTKVYSLKVGTGWISSTTPTPLPWDANSAIGRAAFVDSSLAVQNYRLSSTSAAINVGRRLPGINTPFYNVGRYAQSAPDAGYAEYVPASTGGLLTARGGPGQVITRHRTRARQ